MAKLYFYYSTMNAGKSTTLLQSAYNYRERAMNVMLYTAAIDDRFGAGKITSRIGISAQAYLFNDKTDFWREIRTRHNSGKLNCVLLDEAQFLTKTQVYQLSDVVDELNIPVLCYGIRTDFQGNLFEGSQYLLAWADQLEELKTICECGRKANFVVRLNERGEVVKDGEQIQIGGNDRYLSLCRYHFKRKMGKLHSQQAGDEK
ncbi:thymidine kinase [Actinobacillus succinogenes]|uniref:Thymidine kinase n=1 Tax=Actinobacillus succinogenes (strain ATCC 55618 / DSM 22257 / CCUG 43843 / 130Z) TaxID=339671 RepID=A6VR14_ACTSZ|nr:thymidine kinase [Actinobacillus succinogenes]ABR75411.1 Thymidine kinase [Actinobacillus succinogenes 130Z]PHI40202.1 thymidine kinase [Actinobacillus succinogenes]